MILITEKRDLFGVDDNYYFAHCISADYALGAGIAVEFQKRFSLRNQLKLVGSGGYPDCILIGKVFNLVTKSNYWHKPTYKTLKASLDCMKGIALRNHVDKIAMPKIGCGLDRLQWDEVKTIIEEVFNDTDIEILICYL